MNVRSVDTTAGASGGPTGFDFRAGAVTSVGARHCPDATAAATDAICTGLASTRPCPIADAASSAASRGVGYEPPRTSMPSVQWALNPNEVAALPNASAGSLSARPMNALLHDFANAVARSIAPGASPSKLVNDSPSTVIVAGHGAGVAALLPPVSSAVDVTTLNVDPGG